MTSEVLKNPPLVEAILEIRWRVKPSAQPSQTAVGSGIQFGFPQEGVVDPSYDLLVGLLFDKLSSEYPFHEKLPFALVPADMAPFLVQHRFRKGKDNWPLVQIGPGIATLNDTEDYRWSDFSQRAVRLIRALLEIHPHKSDLVVESLLLRYIDAELFDYTLGNALSFLKEKLKVNFELPNSLFQGEQVEDRPDGLNIQTVYQTTHPRGIVQLKIATGNHRNEKAIVWETSVLSRGQDVPELPSGANEWLEAAHALIHDWFFKLIEGELLRRYSGNE